MRWEDADLEAATMRITRGLQVGPGGIVVFLPPKSKQSRRSFALSAMLVERLRTHRRAQATRRQALGAAWPAGDLICDRGDGAPLLPDAFSRAWKRFAKQAGLPRTVRLHDARHGTATELLRRGVPMPIVSSMLGHSSTAFTADVYQHVDAGMTAAAAQAMDEALGAEH